ncbi:MAG: LacI family DNA-binding transcriptional regulator [Planctomycetes bacterium]|nr:LacI family DNA-binding transcriptional regulator [Planctomycetota bacterium]
MSSVRKIAELAGVSITTVSRALNNDPAVKPQTSKKVLRVASRVGYVPSIGRRITTNIGFAYTQERTLTHPFDSAVMEGVVRGLDEHRFDLVIINVQRDKRPDESHAQFFLRKGLRGVILRTMAATRHVCCTIADSEFPHVVISEQFDAPNVNFIDGDSRHDSARAVEYLISLGHRRIAFAMHTIPDRDHLDRFEGYREALAKHQISLDEEIVFRYPFTLAGGGTVMEMLMSRGDRPTAIFLADPLLGVGAVKKAHEMGVRIPDELSVIGFDDTDMRHAVHPTLTAVCQNANQLGYEASRWLVRAVTGATTEPLRKTIPTFFEINQSTAPPPTRLRRPANRGEQAIDGTTALEQYGKTQGLGSRGVGRDANIRSARP